ncbi:DUF2272 domain-containing protein [Zavarzinia compransoris]|uniref:DUF2272 domain-containing protein n=1 Tax=Zavarzinia compransoris TaxID=1264899 RepID=A0A317E920_9PROT|nr:DUF2272 domain-containing protein [Zavarzinia compransoris]PWR23399.1 hypothetical protein DKG75_02175 [Zavarzinia compransoris]TDP46026.1 hypothetical protein DES42_104107 [Zavarzinia compransoris]
MKIAASLACLAIALVMLGSCANRPGGRPGAALPARPVGDIPVPFACGDRAPAPARDGLAAAMVRIAAAEWTRWGRREVEIQPGRSLLLLPSTAATVWEHEREAFPMLAEYWCATPPHRNYWEIAAISAGFAEVRAADGAIEQEALDRLPVGRSPFAEPWSAAFVSWVVYGAGVPESRFRYSDTHWDYVADSANAGRAFRIAGIDEAAPRAGDLVCATRSAPPARHWRQLVAEGSRPMHCDIVVGRAGCSFSPSGQCIEAIGGNVLQGVTLSRIAVDARGRVMPGGWAPGRDWIAVLVNQGG